jgi:magnesium transporter
LREGNVRGCVATLESMEPVPRAELFVRLTPAEQAAILRASPTELAAALVTDCDSGRLAFAFASLQPGELADALRLVPPDAMADLAMRLPAEAQARVLEAAVPAVRDDVRRLMTFDPESAGGLMTTRVMAVPDVVSVGRALELLRSARGTDPASYVYTVDALGRLSGIIPLHAVVSSNPRVSVRDVMTRSPVRVSVNARPPEIIALFRQRRFVSLPVVDEKERLVGIVTAERVLREQERAEEEVLRSVTGADPREAVLSTWDVMWRRLPWLGVTMTGGLACAAVAAQFQDLLKDVVVLGVFLPIVLALSASAGTQTATVVLSALAGGEASAADPRRLVLKELMLGALAALAIGSAMTGVGLIWPGRTTLAIVLGVSVFASVAWVVSLGAILPVLMRRAGVNASIAAGPLVLGLSDVSTLAVYLGVATLLRATLG